MFAEKTCRFKLCGLFGLNFFHFIFIDVNATKRKDYIKWEMEIRSRFLCFVLSSWSLSRLLWGPMTIISLNELEPVIGIVVIGRNEGDRLITCLESSVAMTRKVIYVDSGSDDDSIVAANEHAVSVIELDEKFAFTAARARNEGFNFLYNNYPELEYIQFVDGDCELNGTWLATGVEFLTNNPEFAIICGRVRERFPERTVYNLLCDMEWSSLAVKSGSCGGNFLVRTSAFSAVDGFRTDLIAGEEAELCMRMQKAGWLIKVLDDVMVIHDANMTSFFQWWKRSVRTGYTYAEGFHTLGLNYRWELNRVFFWGLGLPLIIALTSWAWDMSAAFLVMMYPLQILRLSTKERFGMSRNLIYGYFETIVKFPEIQGVLKYYFNRFFGKNSKLIEYK